MKDQNSLALQRRYPVEEGAVVFGESDFEEDDAINLRDYWRIIVKHRWLIAGVCGGIILATVLFMLTMTPLYTAETTILIERQSPNVLAIQQALSESLGPDEYDYYKTQYQILQSRALAAQVIREQDLEKSLFAGGKKGFVAKLLATLKELFPASEIQGADLLGVKSEFINRYVEDMLDIEPVRGTRLVKIAVTTPDPVLSARIANAHHAAYTRKGIQIRVQANEEAQRFLEEKLVELKDRVEKSEAALNQYRRAKGVISLKDGENIVVERLSDLNDLLTKAEAERIALEAQMHIIRQRAYQSLPEVLKNPLIQTLKGEQTRLEGEYALLLQKFKQGYSEVAQLRAQIDDTKARIQQEIDQIVAGIESAYLTATKNEEELRARMEEQKAATLNLNDASVGYAILEREADTNRELYDSVLERMKEMGVAAELRTSNVSVIDEAESPLKPSSPRILLGLLLSACVGLMAGVGAAFVVDYLDNTLRTPEEVESYLHIPSLGIIPNFLRANGDSGYVGAYASPLQLAKQTDAEAKLFKNGKNGKIEGKFSRTLAKSRAEMTNPEQANEKKELILSHHPLSVISESYRSLRVAVLLSKAEGTPRSLLFTSSTSSEGKTTTAVNMAIVFAQMGVKVLVVDGDLRRPRCHKILNSVKKGPGLTEVLTGQRDLQEVIQHTPVDNLSFLSSGAIPPNPAELVSSKRMQEAFTELHRNYDYIFLDTPPVMPVSDALLFATLVDGVVLVVNGQETPKHLVREASTRLHYARAKILGVVLNKIDMDRGDYGYYYGRYYSYYQPERQDEISM